MRRIEEEMRWDDSIFTPLPVQPLGFIKEAGFE